MPKHFPLILKDISPHDQLRTTINNSLIRYSGVSIFPSSIYPPSPSTPSAHFSVLSALERVFMCTLWSRTYCYIYGIAASEKLPTSMTSDVVHLLLQTRRHDLDKARHGSNIRIQYVIHWCGNLVHQCMEISLDTIANANIDEEK